MKIQLWSIGKEHEPYVKPGVEDFTRRIARYYPRRMGDHPHSPKHNNPR